MIILTNDFNYSISQIFFKVLNVEISNSIIIGTNKFIDEFDVTIPLIKIIIPIAIINRETNQFSRKSFLADSIEAIIKIIVNTLNAECVLPFITKEETIIVTIPIKYVKKIFFTVNTFFISR